MMRTPSLAAVAVLLFASASASHAGMTPSQKCQDAVATAASKYFDARYKAEAKCLDNRAKTGTPADCSTDAAVTTAITAAQTKLSAKINAKCPGTTAADLDLGLACESAATTGDIVTCITSAAHGPLADDAIDLAYHDSGQITDSLLRTCQKSISKAIRKDAGARQKARAKCGKKLTQVESTSMPCPDAKAFTALDKARDALIAYVEKKCTDAQVVNAALKVGGECNDTRTGVPASVFQYLTYDRSGTSNSIPPHVRLSRCLGAAAAVLADTAEASVHALSELGSFPDGVAAGDPTDTSFIAWTRVPTASPPITLEVATDAAFSAIAKTVTGLTPDTGRDYVVKVDVTGLTPSTQYYYRFSGTTPEPFTSRVGRIRTAPTPSSTAPFTFVFTGDSNAFFKPYAVLEGITRDDPDLWLYIGDTIYGDDPRSGSGVAVTAADYRNKYAENREDRALRDVMANVGTATIWDDHEVTNDFYGSPFGAFGPQILAGNEVYREWMPIRENGMDPMQLYRSIKWGDVAEFFMMDNRQYRSAQAYVTEPACLSGTDPAVLPPAGACATEINNPARTYLGAAQKAWFKNALQNSTAKWKFVMNGPVLMNLLYLPYDRWEGYAAERTEILEFIRNPDGNTLTDDHIKNVVYLSTDIHAAIYNPAVANPGPSGGSVPEIVAGAIGMDSIYRELPPSILPVVGSLPVLFPAIQFFDIDRRNYVHFDVSTTSATVTYRDNTGAILKQFTLTAE